MPSAEDFRKELREQIARAQRHGRPHVEVNAGELHRVVGGYPPAAGSNHAMPSCCKVMWDEANAGKAEVVFETPSGQAAALTIRYHIAKNASR